MVVCARFLGCDISMCTRGNENCVCSTKLDKIQTAIGAHDWLNYGVYGIAEQLEKLVIRLVNEETQACADLCRELYSNDGITCAEEIEGRLIDA